MPAFLATLHPCELLLTSNINVPSSLSFLCICPSNFQPQVMTRFHFFYPYPQIPARSCGKTTQPSRLVFLQSHSPQPLCAAPRVSPFLDLTLSSSQSVLIQTVLRLRLFQNIVPQEVWEAEIQLRPLFYCIHSLLTCLIKSDFNTKVIYADLTQSPACLIC